MNLSQKPIFTSLSPNTEKDDSILSLKCMFSPEKWKEGKEIKELERKFAKYLGVKYAISFNSGRSALISILDSLGVKNGDEILLQGFTCNAAVNPILWTKLKPVFVDCDESFNLDPKDLEKKITKRSKAVIVQHTFGQPAKLDEILKICKDHSLFLIEDCAHSLGAKYRGKKVGDFGIASFFSLSRDKIISSVYGGVAVTNKKEIAKKIKRFQEKAPFPSYSWIFQQLLYPLIAPSIVVPLYRIPSFGKLILQGMHLLGILSKAVHKKEKVGKIPSYFPGKLPNVLAVLGLHQFDKLEEFNKHRQRIANIYLKELKKTKLDFQRPVQNSKRIFMRFPILLPKSINSDIILKKMREEGIFLNDGWRKSPIVPLDTDLAKMKYRLGACLKCEEIAERIINLPTHINISEEDARRIAKFIKEILSKL